MEVATTTTKGGSPGHNYFGKEIRLIEKVDVSYLMN